MTETIDIQDKICWSVQISQCI